MAPEKVLSLDQINADLTRQVLRNLIIDCTSNTQVVIKEGSVAGSKSGTAIIEVPSDITVDITVPGVNGLDTGGEALSKWYYIHLIYNPTTEVVAGLFSRSIYGPTMPAGFTQVRAVGAVRNNGSGHFVQFIQRQREVQYFSYQTVLTNGSNFAFTPLGLGVFIPSSLGVNRVYYVLHVYDTESSSPNGILSVDGVNSTAHAMMNIIPEAGLQSHIMSQANLVNNLTNTIWYRITQLRDDMTVHVGGYTLDLY